MKRSMLIAIIAIISLVLTAEAAARLYLDGRYEEVLCTRLGGTATYVVGDKDFGVFYCK